MLSILSLLASAGQSIVVDDVKLEALLHPLSDDLKLPLLILSLRASTDQRVLADDVRLEALLSLSAKAWSARLRSSANAQAQAPTPSVARGPSQACHVWPHQACGRGVDPPASTGSSVGK